jgi:hypothetical protein
MQYDLCNKHLLSSVLFCVEMSLVIRTLEQMFLYRSRDPRLLHKVSLNDSQMVYVVVGVQINFHQGSY